MKGEVGDKILYNPGQ